MEKMKILNVAEKNDVAKCLANCMSSSNVKSRRGFSRYNPVFEFVYLNCDMIMTSVCGHVFKLCFDEEHEVWRRHDPETLFEAPLFRYIPKEYAGIKKTLEAEALKCSVLIIWTDCDREGESIAFEIIKVCTTAKKNLTVFRAKFSEITLQSVTRAMQNLSMPDGNKNNAVAVRQELDFRTGAAFTRFQTFSLKTVKQIASNSIIKYGSCQFPTLGFVVQRFKSIQDFIPQQFWKIRVNHTVDDVSVEFEWKRDRLFEQSLCEVSYNHVKRSVAVVKEVSCKTTSKSRPSPLDTVELEKLASTHLSLSPSKTMKIARMLYSRGLISYPRTQATSFGRDVNLRNLVEQHVRDPAWGEFAQRILVNGPNPYQDKESTKVHPSSPIYPVKYTTSLTGDEQRVYELVTQHFLACCSKDAEGYEITVDLDIAGEKFVASSLVVTAKNYLDVYPFEQWETKEIRTYTVGSTFTPNVRMMSGKTHAPALLTEADLLALMKDHGIGTASTYDRHIDSIKTSSYVRLESGYLIPNGLGLGIIEGYDSANLPLSKPYLRAELQEDLKKVCEGTKDPGFVLNKHLRKYQEFFRVANIKKNSIKQAVEKCVSPADKPVLQEEEVHAIKCSACHVVLVNAVDVQVSEETCPECDVHKLKFTFCPGDCNGGCDVSLLRALKIHPSIVRKPRCKGSKRPAPYTTGGPKKASKRVL